MTETVPTTPPTVSYTITRVLDAPRESVFRAWTEPAQFARWFGPREFITPESLISMDLRPGGAWRACMVAPDGAEALLDGYYREIAAPERLVFTTGDPDNTEGDLASVVTVTFAEFGGRTEMTMRQVGYHTDEDHANSAKAGWELFFERLAEHLATTSRMDSQSAGETP